MRGHLTPRTFAPEKEPAPLPHNRWVVYFALFPVFMTLPTEALVRTAWGRSILLDVMRGMLVFSAVMAGVALWWTLSAHRRNRVSGN